MSRADLLDRVRVSLAKGGFAVSERVEVRPISFDVVARRDNALLIIKVLGNVDALSEPVAEELRTLAKVLGGTPIVIGERTGSGALEDGVAYRHRGIPVLTLPTLDSHILEHVPPMAYATPGGLNVELNGALLRKLREQRSLSLGLLAQAAGVSRRAIQMYEDGMRATIDAALRLEEFLQTTLIHPIDPFQLYQPPPEAPKAPATDDAERPLSPLESEVFRMLRSVGYQVVPTQQSPFNAVSHQAREAILTGVERGQDGASLRRAELMTSVSRVTEKDGMIVVRREVRYSSLGGTPVVQQKELEKVRDPRELGDLLDERRKSKT